MIKPITGEPCFKRAQITRWLRIDCARSSSRQYLYLVHCMYDSSFLVWFTECMLQLTPKQWPRYRLSIKFKIDIINTSIAYALLGMLGKYNYINTTYVRVDRSINTRARVV